MIPLGCLECEEITYGEWGRCVRLTDGDVELVATLEIGPRVIRFGAVGGPNEFFEDVKDEVTRAEKAASFDIFGDEGYWHIYGGHRLWASPEEFPRTYYPDNEPVAYSKIENGVRLTAMP